ncbi:hypothetical protein K469DRAFT_632940 [Zopfia rhizophila CBS 207.26]|uniref:Ubiquitin-like domain-containing protein n=1 Tax=Zopfia rhizophila CBS 207.26 TaxID=1314779 RepID=A0A6A6DZM5_9PEZI|nr:hypothetical protein K469DRAFT_632940 [Zopfia rhizophila CBS 207.26]
MTEDTKAGEAAPPKKRSFFKKSSWQSQVKGEGEREKDIFSHSSDYRDIIAEQARRKKEAQARKEEEKRRKENEERERKRRKVSVELGEQPRLPSSGSRGSGGVGHRGSKARSRTPLSPLPVKPTPDALSARYDDLAKFSSSHTAPKKASDIIDLGSSGDDSEEDIYNSSKRQPIIPTHPKPRASSDEVEEAEDPEFAALAAKARAKRKAQDAAKAAKEASNSCSPIANGDASKSKVKDPIVQLLIESEIENSNPLLVKIRISSTLEKPREAWCAKQGFPKEMTENIFLTWKMHKLYDYTTVARLGVSVNAMGYLSVEGDDNIYTDEDPPKIHLQAWTQEVFQRWKKEEAAAEEARRKAAEPPKEQEEEVMKTMATESSKIRVILRAKEKEDFRISVHPDTTFEHLTSAYRSARKIPIDQPVTLYFDGDRLRTMDVVADSEIEDKDTIEVHFK